MTIYLPCIKCDKNLRVGESLELHINDAHGGYQILDFCSWDCLKNFVIDRILEDAEDNNGERDDKYNIRR